MHRLREVLTSGLTGSPRPLYPGDALRYQDANGTELPAGMWVAMREESVFDVASLTKLFTATVLMTLVEERLLVRREGRHGRR